MVVEWLKTKALYASYTINKEIITVTLTDWVYLNTWYKEFTEEFGLGAIYEYVLENFDPTQAYKVRVGVYTVIIKVKEDPRRAAYDRVYNYVSPGLSGSKSVEYYSWVVYHTTLVEQKGTYYLLGDKEFNRVVTTISSEDIYEVQKLFPRITLDGLTLRLPYLEGMTGIMDELGWNINNQYYVLGTNGYYLPFSLELELAEVVEWILSIPRKYGRHLTHRSDGKYIEVDVHGRDDFLWLANQFRKDLGNGGFLVQLLTQFRVGAYYTVTHKDYTVKFKHTWTRRNIRYAELVYDLTHKSDFSFVTGVSNAVLLYYRILKDSYYDKETDSLRLKGYLFGELGITVDDVVGDLEQVRVDVYQEAEGAYGEPLPMIYSYGGINIQTPYKIIREGEHKHETYPVTLPPLYATEPVEEAYINAYIMGEERRKAEATHTPDEVLITTQHTQNKVNKEEVTITLPDLEDTFQLKDTGVPYKQGEKLPYVSSIESDLLADGVYTVTYIGGEQVSITCQQTEGDDLYVKLYGLVAYKQEGGSLVGVQEDSIKVLRAVFNEQPLEELTYEAPERFIEEWHNYLRKLTTLAITAKQTQQYGAVQALEYHVTQYPDYESVEELELLAEEGGIGLQDFMGLFSQESPEEGADDSGSFLPGVKLVQELKEADTTEGVVDIGTMFGL